MKSKMPMAAACPRPSLTIQSCNLDLMLTKLGWSKKTIYQKTTQSFSLMMVIWMIYRSSSLSLWWSKSTLAEETSPTLRRKRIQIRPNLQASSATSTNSPKQSLSLCAIGSSSTSFLTSDRVSTTHQTSSNRMTCPCISLQWSSKINPLEDARTDTASIITTRRRETLTMPPQVPIRIETYRYRTTNSQLGTIWKPVPRTRLAIKSATSSVDQEPQPTAHK